MSKSQKQANKLHIWSLTDEIRTVFTEIKRIKKFLKRKSTPETSVQRYLFDLEHEVTIGREPRNDLVINDISATQNGCGILVKNHSVYVKCQNTSTPVYIRRGRRTHLVKDQMVKLQSKDILTIGKTDLRICLYEN